MMVSLIVFCRIGCHEDFRRQFQLLHPEKNFLQCYLCLKDGRLRTGDHILQIGGTNVQGMSSEQVAQVLRNCGNSVRMVVARDPKCEITESPPAPASWPVSALPPFQNGNVSI